MPRVSGRKSSARALPLLSRAALPNRSLVRESLARRVRGEPVLPHLVDALHLSLRLGRVREDEGNVEEFQPFPELRQSSVILPLTNRCKTKLR